MDTFICYFVSAKKLGTGADWMPNADFQYGRGNAREGEQAIVKPDQNNQKCNKIVNKISCGISYEFLWEICMYAVMWPNLFFYFCK